MRQGDIRPPTGGGDPTYSDRLSAITVDMMQSGPTLLFQPAGVDEYVVTGVLMVTTLYNAPNNNAQVDIGHNSPSYDNIASFVNYSTALIAVGQFYAAHWLDANYFGNNDLITNSNPLYVNLPTADDGTAEEIKFIPFGYKV